LDREIVRLNAQHKRELENDEISINLMKYELIHYEDDQDASDGEMAKLKSMVETPMGEVKGKGKVSNPTPEASGAGRGRPPPPRHGAVGAPGGGGDPDDEDERGKRKPDDGTKGRRDKIPAP